MDGFLRIVLPVYLLAIFLLAIVWRSYLVWKRTGLNPVVVGKPGSTLEYVERVYPIPGVLLGVVAAVFAVFPGFYHFTAPLFWLEHFFVKIVGLSLLFASLIWIVLAQTQMGASWRIGIDSANRTELVNQGLFKVSRNPIFLGMRVALAGFFLVLPNAFTLVALVLGNVLLQIQVRLEEQHLVGLHGADYDDYKKEVRRWI